MWKEGRALSETLARPSIPYTHGFSSVFFFYSDAFWDWFRLPCHPYHLWVVSIWSLQIVRNHRDFLDRTQFYPSDCNHCGWVIGSFTVFPLVYLYNLLDGLTIFWSDQDDRDNGDNHTETSLKALNDTTNAAPLRILHHLVCGETFSDQAILALVTSYKMRHSCYLKPLLS